MCSIYRQPMPKSRRSPLARLLTLAALAAVGACDTAESPLAPGDESAPSAPVAEPAPTEAVAGGDIAALTTWQRIAFVSARKGGRDIYTMDPQGYNIVRRTATAEEENYPAWSYDNKRIAMVRMRPDASNTLRQDIYLMNADGTNKRWARSATPTIYSITEPSWSPDGSHLVVTVVYQYTPYLATMKVSTGELKFVTLGGKIVRGRQPTYDPTGKGILFVGPTGRTIQTVYPEKNIGYLHVSSDTEVEGPTFSPDGARIAYAKAIAGSYNRDIFVYTLYGGTTKRLTSHATVDWQPTWSPDGTKIAFSSARSGQYQIWTMNAATGGNLTRITHTSTMERDPAWSH